MNSNEMSEDGFNSFQTAFSFLIEEEFSMSTYEINKILENVKKFISGPSRG